MKGSVAVLGFLAALCIGCGNPVSPASPSPIRAGGPSQVSLAAESVPFKGNLEGTQTVTIVQPGVAEVDGQATGTATLLGRFAVKFPHTVTFATGSGNGTYTFTSANGDTLTADFTGTAQQGAIVSIVEIAVITGGTGRFAGATGGFTVQRQFVQSSGITTGSFEGTISRPGE
jgi:hypothetical protein